MIESILKIWVATVIVLMLSLIAFWVGLTIFGSWHDEWSGYNASVSLSDGVCNIAVIPIVGDIVPFSGAYADGTELLPPAEVSLNDTLTLIDMAESDQNIMGIYTPINSSGGAPVTSELITHALLKTELPVVALIADTGASGGYLIATAADTIFASALSDVGSIGITMSYLQSAQKEKEEGLEYIPLSSAKFKDSGSPSKELTAEERALFERDLKENHKEFVRQVAENRKLTFEEVEKLADGSTMTGSSALEHKLIDGIGDREAVREWFARKFEMEPEEIVFCQ